MVTLEALGEDDSQFVREMLQEHIARTGSAKAKRVLDDWSGSVQKFVKVVPVEYRRVLESMRPQPVAAE
jgi:glutamate synthase domain-containing protein 3